MGTTITLLIIWIIYYLLKDISFNQLVRKLKIRQSNRTNTDLFDNYFIDVKKFYFKEYKTLPCVANIDNINGQKVFEMVRSNEYGKVIATYQRNYYNWQQERIEFGRTIFQLSNRMMVKLTDESVEVLFDKKDYDLSNKMLNEFKAHKAIEKEDDYEINIISISNGSLDLKTINITPTALDLDLYYNDDFRVVDATIKERLSKDKDKGIVLLHGLPGTGKTTYLRHLIGTLKKKVMFVSPSVASNLMNPEFMDLLIDNPNSVLVIEDAENIIMDRRFSNQSSVSNILNISDGLLSDCLNVQIICTFNSDLSFVDSALTRKGRLIAKYEFGKLDVEKANRLSNHLGLLKEITIPVTLAEITNPEENHYIPKLQTVVGFKHEMVLEN